MGTNESTLSTEHIEVVTQDETATKIFSRKLSKESKVRKMNVDIYHFHTPYSLRKSNYWFVIFKGTIASLCVMLNVIHLLNIIGLFPPTFSFFKLKTASYNYAMTLATSNINKLFKNHVGLVVRLAPYSEISEIETYSNCRVMISNYQWSQWTEFEKQADQRCGIKTYIRHYNLRIMKVVQSTTKETLQTHCPATVQYKYTWERACCHRSDLQPLENYVNLPYDKAFCIVKSSLRSVNASELSTVCETGKLWIPLPMAAYPVNNSYYQRSNVVKTYEIQRGAVLNSYWIGVERIDGRNWLINGGQITLDSRFNCTNHCYNMEILLSTEAYRKYSNRKKYFVCVKNEKWELFSSKDREKCMAVCIVGADNNSNSHEDV
ncbi:UDP-N-acetylmuramate--L-alanine ligase [Dirofilaria immitis]